MELKLEAYTKDIGGNRVLDNVSMVLTEGKIYGLQGKNGCGKTMLMRAMCGLIRPSSGRVFYNGAILGKDIDILPSVGALIENPAFIADKTGLDNLKMLASLIKDCSLEDIKMVLEMVGLEPEDKRVYQKYSLGMRQRLGIAGALLGEPEVIILDEPINALDVDGVKQIRSVLLNLKKSHIIVVACHDREEMYSLADEIYNMEDGMIIGKEYPDEEGNLV